MSSRKNIPTREDVNRVLSEMADYNSGSPSTLALARKLGIANTTFRRHFPDITNEINQQKVQAAQPGHGRASQKQRTDLEGLRTENRILKEHLELAVASIQRLTLENDRLRQQLTTDKAAPHRIQPGGQTR